MATLGRARPTPGELATPPTGGQSPPSSAIRRFGFIPMSPGSAWHLGQRRDAVADRMRALLLGAAFDGRVLKVAQAASLIREGDRLLGQAALLAS